MKTTLSYILIFIQLFEASAELILKHLTEEQSLGLSCSPQQNHSSLQSLHLYHRSARGQTTVLSMAEGDEVKVDPVHRGRLQICGGLNSPMVNVTISDLQHSDTGLYIFELSYREGNSAEQIFVSPHTVFLLVDGSGRSCCFRYPTLLLTIFTAAGLLVLTLSWMAIESFVKARRHRPPPHSPIYEEMNRKQQSPASPQNNHKASTHLEEEVPVYANPQIRQPQDNYYACPRQLALRA